jgi:hypothetical protein
MLLGKSLMGKGKSLIALGAYLIALGKSLFLLGPSLLRLGTHLFAILPLAAHAQTPAAAGRMRETPQRLPVLK